MSGRFGFQKMQRSKVSPIFFLDAAKTAVKSNFKELLTTTDKEEDETEGVLKYREW